MGYTAIDTVATGTAGDHLPLGWGRTSFDYMMNNGGSQRPGSFAKATEKDFDDLVDVMFKGVGLAEDVSGAIAALLEDRNHWVNGQGIEVSGGVHL